MLTNNIGSVVVTLKDKPVGIITEKDYLERVIKPNRDPHQTQANEIMSAPLKTVDEEVPLVDALNVMSGNRKRRLAVTKKGRLVGILTERRALKV